MTTNKGPDLNIDDLRARLLSGGWPATPVVDARGITSTIERALASAGLDARSPLVRGINATIQDALAGAGLAPRHATAPPSPATIDGIATRIDEAPDRERAPVRAPSGARGSAGEFMTDTFTNHAGARDYKLYVPSHDGSERPAMPLIVMLHGCSQNPDDFAAGTRMNDLAEEHGFLVLYPAQPVNANASRCWNWFRPGDQQRDAGEPSLIAGMTLDVATRYGVDARRIFVAGLSAGGAMAVVLGAAYPELFAAVGVHSGIPYGVAHDVPSAFAAMRNASGSRGRSGIGTAANGARHGVRLPPTIVFHGDRDTTVHAENGADIAAAVADGHADAQGLHVDVQEGVAAGGRAYRRTVYRNVDNQSVVEQWLLNGAGHAWSGGSARGSFTDPSGPDASAEMIRFFLSQQRAGTA